jgi:hypothetical protein
VLAPSDLLSVSSFGSPVLICLHPLTIEGLAWPEHGIPVHRVLKPSGRKAHKLVARKPEHVALLVAEGVGMMGEVWDGVGEVFEGFVV